MIGQERWDGFVPEFFLMSETGSYLLNCLIKQSPHVYILRLPYILQYFQYYKFYNKFTSLWAHIHSLLDMLWLVNMPGLPALVCMYVCTVQFTPLVTTRQQGGSWLLMLQWEAGLWAGQVSILGCMSDTKAAPLLNWQICFLMRTNSAMVWKER